MNGIDNNIPSSNQDKSKNINDQVKYWLHANESSNFIHVVDFLLEVLVWTQI
jgi:hypothetical protein